MPVAVSIPTKIRLDREAIEEHPEWIDAALDAAVGRALLSSKNSVLKLRGDYMAVELHPPTFLWKGRVPASAECAALERRISKLLADLTSQHGIGTLPEVTPPEVMPSNPAETFDTQRGSALARIYAIDSYSGGDVELPVDDKHPLLYDYVPVVNVFLEAMSDEINGYLITLADSATPEHPLGVIYRYVDGGDVRWQVVIIDGFTADPKPRPNIVGAFTFAGFSRFEYLGEKATPPFKRVPYVPPPAPGTADIIDVPGDVAARGAKLKEMMGQSLTDDLRRNARKPINVTTKKFEEAIAERVDNHIKEEANRLGNVSKAVKLTLGTSLLFVWISSQAEKHIRWKGTATLTALETMVKVPKAKAKKGDGSGAGNEGGQSAAAGKRSGGGKGTGDCPPDEIGLPSGLTGDEGPSTTEQPLRGEPALDELGDAGELLEKQKQTIATKLGLTSGKYAGQFCWQAANCLNEKAIACQGMAESSTGQNKARDAAQGNMGAVDFTPGASKIITSVRELAAVVPVISQLMATVVDIFLSDAYRCSIHGLWRGKGPSWALRFMEDVVPKLEEAVGNLFLAATRSSLLQLLATSLEQIGRRQKAMDRYAPMFEKWILPYVVDLAELDTLHQRLRDYGYAKKTQKATQVVAASTATASNWLLATTNLVATLQAGAVVWSIGAAYEIVEDGGVDKIRGTNSVLWTLEDLELALALRRGVAEGIDPLMKQITDTPDAVKRFKNTTAIREELEKLLAEMARNNQEMRQKAIDDPMFAFKSSSIAENIPNATVRGGKYVLQGVHKLAHEQIGDAFGNDSFYATGLNRLFDTEEGKEALKGFGVMTGFVLLCVLVPGGAFIAFGAGVGLASHEVGSAYEKQRLYKSLIDPDKVLSSADVEVTIFVAWFGFALSLIPEAGTATKGLIAGGRAVLKGETKTLGKMAGKAAAKRVAKEVAEYAAKDILEAFVKELSLNVVITEVIQKAMSPLIEEIQSQAALRSTSVDMPHGPDPEQVEFIELVRSIDLSAIADDDAPEANDEEAD